MLRQHWEQVACLSNQLLASMAAGSKSCCKQTWVELCTQVKIWMVFVQDLVTAQKATRQVRQGRAGALRTAWQALRP